MAEIDLPAGHGVASIGRLPCRSSATAPATLDQRCVGATTRARSTGSGAGVRYGYEAFAGFHVVQLLTEGIPLLLFSDPKAVPSVSPWSLCVNGNLGSMEANVMAGRALFGRFQLPEGPRRCAIFLVQEKVMQGTSRSADCIPSNCPKVT